MWKMIKILLAGIVFSMFYFPFEFTFLPGMNTKKILAALGLVCYLIYLIHKKELKFPRNIILTSVFALVVSVVGLIAVVYNGTPDYVYSSYIISMLVWLSAAFFVCKVIKLVHGRLDIMLLCNYLIAVCVAQCIIAQIIDTVPSFKALVDTYISQGQIFLTRVKRLYGIGANLDVAGSRFAVSLIVLTCVLISHRSFTYSKLALYIVAYVLIAVLGSMVARTTYVGVVISLIYLVCIYNPFPLTISSKGIKIISLLVILIIISILILGYLYDVNPQIRRLLRFAFEGFFNLAETGEWSIASNEFLKTMYVFPDNIKTWIIGDGYFNNPVNVDPYYVGEITGGYYKGTDVGYLRFIFYFGLIGLCAFMLFFIKVAQYCVRGFPKYKWMFILLLTANFVIWLKVSTDIFLVFALFLCASNMQNKEFAIETNLETES